MLLQMLRTLADELGLDLPAYVGMAQCVKL